MICWLWTYVITVCRQGVFGKLVLQDNSKMQQGLSTQQSIYTNAHYADKIRQRILAERHIVYYKIKPAEALEGLENRACLSTAAQPMYQHTVRAFPDL